MYQDENHPETHLERSAQPRLPAPVPDAEVQRKRMLIALAILLVALAAVIVKDWDFWFPAKGEAPEKVAGTHSRMAAPATESTAPAANRERKPAKPATPPPADAPFTATAERAALPPLQVEVVAGNRHVSVPAKSSAIRLDVGSGATAASSPAPATGVQTPGATVSAADRVQLSPQAQQSVSVSVPPDYPLLARQMKVQGVVSLQALIARDGTIQELQIMSGPEILATAAREAVKQWHFKPYLQNGQPVETQARITVNFTISTN